MQRTTKRIAKHADPVKKVYLLKLVTLAQFLRDEAYIYLYICILTYIISVRKHIADFAVITIYHIYIPGSLP